MTIHVLKKMSKHLLAVKIIVTDCKYPFNNNNKKGIGHGSFFKNNKYDTI